MTESNSAVRNVYSLQHGVRVFRTGEEIRFRKGVWNFNEAILRLTGQEPRVVAFFDAVYGRLIQGNEADAAVIAHSVGANSDELNSFCVLLDSLKRQQYLQDPQRSEAGDIVSALMGGNISGFEQYVATPRRVLFFSDSTCAATAAKNLAAEMGLPLDVLDYEHVQAISLADLTTKTDAVQHVESHARFERLLLPYTCVLGCMAAPNVTFLRNINRLLIAAEKPLILGLIDGPFVSILSTLATETGCFECYEQRMMARLEDTVVYHQFTKATVNTTVQSGRWQAPALHLLVSAVLSEGGLYASAGVLRLAGRIINTYLPLLEIQVQDLLRVPYCPACGFIAKSQMNELYTSSKRLIDEMLLKVEVEG